jgi:hypothetical protein
VRPGEDAASRLGSERGAGVGETDDELGDEVLGVGGGASVAGDEEFAAGLHGLGGGLNRDLHR